MLQARYRRQSEVYKAYEKSAEQLGRKTAAYKEHD